MAHVDSFTFEEGNKKKPPHRIYFCGRVAVLTCADMREKTPGETECTLTDHSDLVNSFAVTGAGRLVSCSGDRTVRLWS